jgi:hypothetical protein
VPVQTHLRTGRKIARPPSLFHIEWDNACMDEGLDYCKKHDICWFDNIAQFFRPELRATGGMVDQVLANPHLAVEILAGIIANKQAMTLVGHCRTHDKQCKLRPSKRHIAGTSCTPFSSRGAKLGLSDPAILYTLAWIGLMLELEIGHILRCSCVRSTYRHIDSSIRDDSIAPRTSDTQATSLM